MRRIAALCALLLLAACADPTRRVGPDVDPVMEPEAVYEVAPACSPGEGDGIGGTGCQAALD